MVKFISEAEKWKLKKSRNPLFWFGSQLTFSMIQGGRAINIVPDLCSAKLDVRTVPELKKSDIEKSITDLHKRMKSKIKNFQLDYSYDSGHEAYSLSEKEAVTKSLKSSFSRIMSKQPEIVVNGPSHIGALLYKHNIPVIVFGPEGDNVHSYNEFVKIDSLPTTSEIYANTILNFFSVA